jgi:DNA-binding MarR family transcriptional regulator
MPDQRLYYLINRAQHHLRKLVDRVSLERVGVSSAQVGALFLIAQRPGCSQADIATELGQDESAITTMLKRMERSDLIERRRNPNDGRSKLVHLTRHGETTLRSVGGLLTHFNKQLTEGFTADELEVVLRFIQHLNSLEEADIAP